MNKILYSFQEKQQLQTEYTKIKHEGFLKVLKNELSMAELYKSLIPYRAYPNNKESRETLTWQLKTHYLKMYPERLPLMIAKVKTEELVYGISTRRSYGHGWFLYLKDIQDDFKELQKE